MTSGSKIQEINFGYILGSRYTFARILLSNLYLFDSIFSGMAWIDKPHNCDERICFPYTIMATVATKKNASSKTWILYIDTTIGKFSWLNKH